MIATWTKKGLQTLESAAEEERHSSAALRKGGEFLKDEIKLRSEDRIAAAGGKDCSDGDKTITAIAAEKNAESLVIQSISRKR